MKKIWRTAMLFAGALLSFPAANALVARMAASPIPAGAVPTKKKNKSKTKRTTSRRRQRQHNRKPA